MVNFRSDLLVTGTECGREVNIHGKQAKQVYGINGSVFPESDVLWHIFIKSLIDSRTRINSNNYLDCLVLLLGIKTNTETRFIVADL